MKKKHHRAYQRQFNQPKVSAGKDAPNAAQAPATQLLHIASRPRVGASILSGVLPNPDPILKAAGKDVASYRELLAQPRIGGNVRRRKAAVLGLQRALEQGEASDAVYTFIEDWLADIDLDRLLRGLLDAPLYGYQPVEILWQPVGRFWIPADVCPKPPEWFRFDADSNLRFMAKDAGQQGELCDPVKFVVASHDATWVNPYGQPDLAMCYWPGNFLKSGLKFWVQFIEKYGTPWVVGKVPRGTDPREIEAMLEALLQVRQDGVMASNDDNLIEIIEAGGKSSSSQAFREFLEYCRSDINIALLGQDQTTDKDTNHASATAGADVAASIRDGDKGVVLSAMNRIIRLVVEANFGEVDAPTYNLWEQESIDKTQAERDQILAATGLRFKPEYYAEEYGIAMEHIDTTPLPAPSPYSAQPLAFAEPLTLPAPTSVSKPDADNALLDAAVRTLKVQSEPLVDGWVAQVQKLVDETPGDFDALQDALLAAYGNLDERDLVDVMGKAFDIASVAGRLAVKSKVAEGEHG